MAQRDYSWLLELKQHVAYTLAQAGNLIAKTAEILFDYLGPGPLELGTVPEGNLAHVTVTVVAPLPATVARLAADALTQLRAAIEHTVYAEVEHELGLRLNEDEARRVEMPACAREEEFRKWLASRRRSDLEPLRVGSHLVARIRDPQPYHRRDADLHTLSVLAEHNNLAKHRTPAVAATLLGVVIADWQDPTLVLASGADRPLAPSDVLASGPRDKCVPLSIWRKVSIQRPQSGTWSVLTTQLGEIEEWVRTVTIPRLIIGRHHVDPLPPQLDTTVGHVDLPAVLTATGQVPAAKRSSQRIQADVIRGELADILAMHLAPSDARVVAAWIAVLDDEQVLERHDRLAVPASRQDIQGL
jgi:hypothetical protein